MSYVPELPRVTVGAAVIGEESLLGELEADLLRDCESVFIDRMIRDRRIFDVKINCH